jgi:xanthine dehydrogenase molybdopterin binding subunit/xanthine dehydrogenase small subunit
MTNIRFNLNGNPVEAHELEPDSTLLQFLRQEKKLTGTKEGCAEGDCGACTVLLVDPLAEGGPALRSVNSCLLLTASLEGQHLFSVEGLKDADGGEHAVQKAMVEHLGSQCGYCTPGFVMAMAEAAHRSDMDAPWKFNDQLCGNLCRCTGYRPIRDALTQVAGSCPKDALSEAKADGGSFGRVDGQGFSQPTNLEQFFDLIDAHPQARLVAGATDLGLEITKQHASFSHLISLLALPELRQIKDQPNGFSIGAAVALTDVESFAADKLPMLARMLRYFGSRQIKHRGTLGGNLCNASPIGDSAPVLMALDATLVLASRKGTRRVKLDDWFLGYRQTAMRPGELLIRIEIPRPVPTTLQGAYKVSRRRELDISAICAGMSISLDDQGHVAQARIAFGGMAATTQRAASCESALLGQSWNLENVQSAARLLDQDFTPISDHRSSADYRAEVARNLLLGFFLETQNGTTTQLPAQHSGTVLPGHDDRASKVYPAPTHHRGDASPLYKEGAHESAQRHANGAAMYVEDVATKQSSLVVELLASSHAHARITKRCAASARQVPGVRAVLFASDIPGDNLVGPIIHDEPLLAEDEVHYAGQAIAVVVAENYAAARAGVAAIDIEYESLPAINNIAEALQAESFLSENHVIARGDVETALSGAAVLISGEISSGGQDHFYLETQASLATPEENGCMHLLSSTQHPTEVQRMVALVLDKGSHEVGCETPRLGGAFGGKESQAANYACLAALGAQAVDEPVLVWLNREQDMAFTGKRHPFFSRYQAGFSDEGDLLALKVEIFADGGWTTDLSPGVHDRALFHLDNAYFIPNLHFSGRVCRSNRPSNTAFRGFGGPQGMLVVEEVINRFAESTGLDPAAVRARNYYEEGGRDWAPYGQKIEEIRLQRLHAELLESSDYDQRKEEIASFNEENVYLKRGLAFQPIKFGISFTVSVLNQAGALVLVYSDGSAQINHGGTEMGQGLHSKMGAVAAECLGLPSRRVRVMHTHTEKVPNTTPTAASSGSDLNGAAVADACNKIIERMRPVAATLLDCSPEDVHFEAGKVFSGAKSKDFAQVAAECWAQHISLSATGFWATPGVAYDRDSGTGTPFFYFAYGAAVSEVELNGLTGEHRVRRVDILHDAGNPLLPSIDLGQVEGAFIQGMGWLTNEEVIFRDDGSCLTVGPSTYKIPSIGDTPAEFNVRLLERAANERVIGGSKAVGEPPFPLAISVLSALRHAVQAFGPKRKQVELAIPATPEALLRAVDHQRKFES